MTIRSFPANGYATQPWKNGQGATDEICLLPEGATRDGFSLRVSRATIAEPGLFSAFPDVERTIALIEGAGLALDFGDRTVRLEPWKSSTFDSGLTPVGRPEGGPVRVLNVMGTRGTWLPGPARLEREATDLAPAAGGLAVVFALQGATHLTAGSETLAMAEGDSALLDGETRLVPAHGAVALVVALQPARA